MNYAFNEPFAPSGTSGQLQLNGVNVTSDAVITKLIWNGWDGRVILASGSRTNTALYSQDYSQAAWTLSNGTLTSAQTAPDGTSTAWRLNDDTSTSEHYIRQDFTPSAGTYTTRVRLKAGTLSTANIQINNNGSWTVSVIDLSAGTITSGPGSLTAMGSGWYLFACPTTYVSGAFQVVVETGSGSHTGTSQYILVWGFEFGLYNTGSYIATTTASATLTNDYSVTSGGAVTLATSATGTYSWTGSGTITYIPSVWGYKNSTGDNRITRQNATKTSGAEVASAINAMAFGAALANATALPSGVEATSAVGTATASGTGGSVNATATPAGVQATASQGTATVSAGVVRTFTGQQVTAAVGSASASGTANTSVSGVQATAAVGTATASGTSVVNATATPSGVASTASVGSATGSGASNVIPFGLFVTTAVGTATASGGASGDGTGTPTGVEASATGGTPIADGGSIPGADFGYSYGPKKWDDIVLEEWREERLRKPIPVAAKVIKRVPIPGPDQIAALLADAVRRSQAPLGPKPVLTLKPVEPPKKDHSKMIRFLLLTA